MGITDELREYALGWDEGNRVRSDLTAIADRIDVEHERAVADAEWATAPNDARLKELGYITLPKDADGEYIHIGDEMEGVDKYDSLKKVMGKVITVSFKSDGIVDVAVQAWSSDGKSWHRAYLDPDASVYRHHRAPTVEDVLTEFADRVCSGDHAVINGTYRGIEDTDLLAEYAAKLQLRED
jgi:hypothetical protein